MLSMAVSRRLCNWTAGEVRTLSFGAISVRRSNKFANPFYGLLLVAGLVFAVTSAAYCVMVVRESRAAAALSASDAPPAHALIVWISRHGDAALFGELAMLAVCTVAAIGTDSYWQRRAASQRKHHEDAASASSASQ
jgi:hypothetical protein